MEDLINRMNEKQQREFALICASRAVDRVDIPELNEYFMLICFAVESDMLKEIKACSEYMSAFWVAYKAGVRVTYSADFWASLWAADRASYGELHIAVDKEIQKEIALNILEGGE